MQLNVSQKTEHTDVVSAVAWSPDCTLMSCADDKILCKWGPDGEVITKITSLAVYVTSISWLPAVGKQAPDLMAVSCMDGTFRFISKSGREEKKVQAHESGAVIVVRWSHDGSAILTGGEDGDVKIWSRSGNLRSVLVSTGQCVYSICWGPDDEQVVVASGKSLIIKSVQSGGGSNANRKNVQWDAHGGIVLCVDWNVANKLIISGGEDCIYRIWDNYGRQMFISKPSEHVITSLAWNPNGESFAVGTYNLLRLCDKTGWTHSRQRLNNTGSLLSIAWTFEGTQLAAACGNGNVLFAQVIGRRYEWRNIEVTLVSSKKILVEDIVNESSDNLEFPRDRVVEIGLGYDWLVVMTITQCYVYNIQNLNTPHIFDIRAPPHYIHMCKKYFLTLDPISGIQIISYEGRVICTPKFQGLRAEYLTREMVALSPDTVVIVDSVDSKNIYTIDANSGKILSKLTHSTEVVSVLLNQHTLGPQERTLVFCDRNKDLYVASIQQPGGGSHSSGSSGGGNAAGNNVTKLHCNVESYQFNDETDSLVLLADSKLILYYHAAAIFIEKDLLPYSYLSSDATEYGRNAQIISFTNNRVSIRKIDGAIVIYMIPSEIYLIYELGRESKWDECLRLCRHLKSSALLAENGSGSGGSIMVTRRNVGNNASSSSSSSAMMNMVIGGTSGECSNSSIICIWVLLGLLALNKKQLNIAELCYAELNEVAKVEYLKYIQQIPSEEGKQAEMALFKRLPAEAERILLQASPPLVYRAIKLNIELYKWGRALDIATKYKTHVDTVLAYRERYLKQFKRNESDTKYMQYNKEVTIDWNVIEKKEERELEEEANRKSGGGGSSSNQSRK